MCFEGMKASLNRERIKAFDGILLFVSLPPQKFRETLAASGELLQLIGYDVRNGDPNLMQELFSYLQKNTMELSNVRLNHFQLTTAQWTHLSNALGTLSNLSSLDLAGVGEDGVQAIAAMLNTNSSLQHLTITAWEPAHMVSITTNRPI